ncbi:hypothetical protein [Leptodesmis sp.]|uniref:hypothetical protein n=1 Tax=Leptodesmis sp. TaxID=3100501 RepID=UPI00405356AA
MHVEWIDAKEPTIEEVYQLEMLKNVIKRATADGILTQDEITTIRAQIWQRKGDTAEQLYRRMELYRILVTEKVNQGKLAAEVLGN